MVVEQNTFIDKNMQKTNNVVNEWLINDAFLKNTNFPDLYYLETLCYKIYSFLKNVPVPVYTSYDYNHHSIYFLIGTHKKYFPVDMDISYYDYITLVRRWLCTFYPKYTVSFIKEIDYDDAEILQIVEQEGISLNDALLRKKKVPVTEYCFIDKVYLTKDEFILHRYHNNILVAKEVRISGSITENKLIPLSKFLDGYRKLIGDEHVTEEQKKTYIEQNSKLVHTLSLQESTIVINYLGKMMINFFKINFSDLYKIPLIQITDFTYHWGRFAIMFESRLLRDDCIALYTKLKNQIKEE